MKKEIGSSCKFRNTILVFLAVILFTAGCSRQQAKEGYKSINGTEIYYKRMGDGEPLVVIHGGPVLDHSYLLPHLKPLADQHELIFFDQRLSGRSSADVDSSEVTLKNMIEDIEELRKALNLGKIHILGHSWGGLLAMKYAIAYPDNMRKLALSNPMPASAELWQQEQIELSKRTTAADRKARQKVLSSEDYKANDPKAIEKRLLLSFENQFHDSTFVDSLDFYIPDDYKERNRKFGYLMTDLRKYDLHSQLSELQVPTLVIYGSDEPAADLSGKKLDKIMPDSKLKIIEGSGHFPFIEKPDSFLSNIRSFLK